MAINKNAFARYLVIDRCLREAFNKGSNGLTRKELMKEVAFELYGEAGNWIEANSQYEFGVSKRTFYDDIEKMKMEPFNAPIDSDSFESGTRFFYYKPYALGDSLLKDDIFNLYRAQIALNQLGLSSLAGQIDDLVELASQKHNVNTIPQSPPLYLEYREFKGLEHLSSLFEHIIDVKKPDLVIDYKPFNEEVVKMEVRPYFLKEFNRRWYLIGIQRKENRLVNLALDRMLEFYTTHFDDILTPNIERIVEKYQHLIGVTIPAQNPDVQEVVLELNAHRALYVLTKPLHPSQKVLSQDDKTTVIQLDVVVNKELEARILEFGEDCKVISPKSFQEKIKTILLNAVKLYEYGE